MIAGEAGAEAEGEEEEADDEADDDEPYDDGRDDDHDAGGGDNSWYTDVPVAGTSSTADGERHDTPRPRRRIAQKSNGDIAAGRGEGCGAPTDDQGAEERPNRSVQNDAIHTMESPEGKERKEEGEDEINEEEESEEPSSSYGRDPSVPRRRGTEAEREGMMENDIFRPSLSNMVADDLVNFGLRPQQMILRTARPIVAVAGSFWGPSRP